MLSVSRPFAEIRPFVRFAGHISVNPADCAGMRIAYDHCLFYVQCPRAVFLVKGREFHLCRGDLFLLLSGIPCRILPDGCSPAFLIVNFDFFSGSDAQKVPAFPLPMDSPADYSLEKQTEQVCFSEDVFSEGFAVLNGCKELLPDLEELTAEYERSELLSAQQMSALLTLCLNRVFRSLRKASPQRGPDAHRDILEYLSAHMTEDLTNRSVAEVFHYHPNYVSQIVREQTGLSLHRYLLRLRVHRAAELLLTGGLSVREVAAQTGFPDANYFAQYFRRCVGCSPSAFRGRDAGRLPPREVSPQ